MKKNFLKIVISLFSISMFSACAHITSKEDNISAVENKTLAAVISGCSYDYQTKFIITADSRQECIATWKNIDNGEVFFASGYNSINFIKPGIYEFISYKSKLTKRSSYKKQPNALSIFSKLIVKPGEVLYIGNLNVNSKKSTHVLESMSFSQNHTAAKEYLKSIYPSLVNKMLSYQITFSPGAQKIKKLVYKHKENNKDDNK